MPRRSLTVCLVGDFSDPKDEGMKKTAYKLASTLSRTHKVLPLHVKSVYSPNFWQNVRLFRPDLILYVGGPSLLSFMIAKAVSTYCALKVGKRPKTILLALHPSLPSVLERVSSLFRPDLILAQSYASQDKFRRLGFRTLFLPAGVDTEKFTPITTPRKTYLRKKYGLEESAFVVLHVGSVRRNRGLEILTEVQKNKGNCVLVVGSTSMPMDQSVLETLTATGCLVWRRHFPRIEELYQLADAYVFPVVDRLGSIELPLSVMEAMACNLPVVSTKFGALPRILQEEEGLIFVEGVNEIPSIVEKIKNENPTSKTRERILPYSWEGVTSYLFRCFRELIEEHEL